MHFHPILETEMLTILIDHGISSQLVFLQECPGSIQLPVLLDLQALLPMLVSNKGVVTGSYVY